MKRLISVLLAAVLLICGANIVLADGEPVYVNPELPLSVDLSDFEQANNHFHVGSYEVVDGYLTGYKDVLAFQSKFAYSAYDVTYELAICEDEQVAEGSERYFTFAYLNPNPKHNGVMTNNINLNFTIDIDKSELYLSAGSGFGVNADDILAGPVALDIDTDMGTFYKFGVSVSEGRMRFFIDGECLIDYIDEANKYYIGYSYEEVDPVIMVWWSNNNLDMYKSVEVSAPGELYPFPVPTLYGDANGDGKIDINDVTMILKYIARYKDLEIDLEAANTLYDEAVNINDVAHLLKYIAKWNNIVLGPVPEGVIGETADFSNKTVDTAWELANRAAYIAKNYGTLYVMGGFGAPLSDANKAKYIADYEYNSLPERVEMINGAAPDTFAFDCSGLIKGILWGWSGETGSRYGGASYTYGDVPDFNSDSTVIYADGTVTGDWSRIEIGEILWSSGHMGIYIGDGLAVESTPGYTNNVQITAVGNIGEKEGYNARKWMAHGKLKFVSYTGEDELFSGTDTSMVTYTVKSGDTMSKIASTYNISVDMLVLINGIADVNKISVGQVLSIPQ